MSTPDRSSSPDVRDAVRMESVTKRFGRGDAQVTALRDVSVRIPRGTFTAVMGPSGSGKSTFLHCAAGLDRPTSGSVFLGSMGTDLTTMSESKLTVLRRTEIGFVFQAFNLLPALTVRQNITLPLRLAGKRADRRELVDLLHRMGLAERAGDRPVQLSGGQQQRVAIARALIAQPEVVFADEPTGALDSNTTRDILSLLRHTVDTTGQTTVMVTHDPIAASYADAVIFLADGRIVNITASLQVEQIAERMTRLAEES
jgi:putative ABC transport system ATP-binding protein